MKKLFFLLAFIIISITQSFSQVHYQRNADNDEKKIVLRAGVTYAASAYNDVYQDVTTPILVDDLDQLGYTATIQYDLKKCLYIRTGVTTWSGVAYHTRQYEDGSTGYKKFRYMKYDLSFGLQAPATCSFQPFGALGGGYVHSSLRDFELSDVVGSYELGLNFNFGAINFMVVLDGFADITGNLSDGGSPAVHHRGTNYSKLEFTNNFSFQIGVRF